MSGNGLRFLRQVVETGTRYRGFESLLEKIKVVSGGNGKLLCEMTVTEDHQNRLGTLHGGMTATLVDAVSTWALLSSERQVAGVSVDMNISYLKAAKVGEDILIEANALKIGKTLAFLTVDITKKSDGSLIAQVYEYMYYEEKRKSCLPRQNLLLVISPDATEPKTMSGSGFRFLRQMVGTGTGYRGFESVLEKIKVVSGGNGKLVCEMTVREEHQNCIGTLHGGMTATLVDTVSTWALLSSERQVAGVSTDMNVSYLKAAKVGEDILIEAKALKIGKTFAFLTVDITKKSDGSLIAQGKNTKFIGS